VAGKEQSVWNGDNCWLWWLPNGCFIAAIIIFVQRAALRQAVRNDEFTLGAITVHSRASFNLTRCLAVTPAVAANNT